MSKEGSNQAARIEAERLIKIFTGKLPADMHEQVAIDCAMIHVRRISVIKEIKNKQHYWDIYWQLVEIHDGK